MHAIKKGHFPSGRIKNVSGASKINLVPAEGLSKSSERFVFVQE